MMQLLADVTMILLGDVDDTRGRYSRPRRGKRAAGEGRAGDDPGEGRDSDKPDRGAEQDPIDQDREKAPP